MILIADSGSTNTDWLMAENGNEVLRITTQGLNPIHQQEEVICELMRCELLPQLDGKSPDGVYFYGSGCNEFMSAKMEAALARVFPECHNLNVFSDLLAAARAVCGKSEGIACIMGTGANSCLYDGERIVANTPPLGYILGDEGSGAVLGKLFVNAVFKGLLPEEIKKAWLEESGMSYQYIINKVYREPLANRFLASLVPFMAKHIDAYPALQTMIVQEFQRFFRYNLIPYGRPDLPVGFVGGVAATFRTLLADAAEAEGFHLGVVMRAPLEGLLHCHTASV